MHRDDRGFFLESYRKDAFQELGIADEFVQDNHSMSARGVLRGIHFQDLSAPMAKLVRCTSGRLYDVAVDLRVGAPQFGQWVGVELSADNMRQLFVPVGFGHGFVVLSDMAELQYKCSSVYTPSAERAIIWNDRDLQIDWPIKAPILSTRDRQALTLRQYQAKPAFHDATPVALV